MSHRHNNKDVTQTQQQRCHTDTTTKMSHRHSNKDITHDTTKMSHMTQQQRCHTDTTTKMSHRHINKDVMQTQQQICHTDTITKTRATYDNSHVTWQVSLYTVHNLHQRCIFNRKLSSSGQSALSECHQWVPWYFCV